MKLIYIDPPYNTGKDFIYPDNFADPLGDYLKKTGQVDEEGNWTSSVTDADGRYDAAACSLWGRAERRRGGTHARGSGVARGG